MTPYSPEAERAVLGSMLLSSNSVADAAAMLRTDDFYDHGHKAIFSAIVDIWHTGASPDVALVAERLKAKKTGADTRTLLSLQANAPGFQTDHYARIVADYATRRRLVQLGEQLVVQATAPDCDVKEVVASASAHLALAQVPAGVTVEDVLDVDDFCAKADPPTSWVIPGLMDGEDRTVIIAAEGVGKSYLLRQLALCAGQGIHPFTLRRIPPVTSLLVDLENPGRIVRAKTRGLLTLVKTHCNGTYEPTRTWIWHRPGGVDLRSRSGAAELDAVCAKVKPRLVCLGPLYKAFRADSSKREHDIASEVAAVFDDLRTRHGFALVLEHHAPLRQGGVRELRPFGSLLWTQWPEVGIKLVPTDDSNRVLKVGTWRGSRDERPWPTELHRGREFPWEAKYAEGMPA